VIVAIMPEKMCVNCKHSSSSQGTYLGMRHLLPRSCIKHINKLIYRVDTKTILSKTTKQHYYF